MPWVRFSADFDFKPKPSLTLAYRAGDEKLVTTPCAQAAVAAGKGTIVKKARKGKADG
jgi:hypothetical protein